MAISESGGEVNEGKRVPTIKRDRKYNTNRYNIIFVFCYKKGLLLPVPSPIFSSRFTLDPSRPQPEFTVEFKFLEARAILFH